MFFFCVSRPPPLSTLFPYTTLFRSVRTMVTASGDAIAAAGLSAAGRSCSPRAARVLAPTSWKARGARGDVSRSEEHTSELQSRRDLVCRLLLEKKKIKTLTIAADID